MCTILNVSLSRRLVSLDVNLHWCVCVCVSWGCDRLLYLPLKPFITESPLIFCPAIPAPPSLPANFLWAVLTHSSLQAAPALFFWLLFFFLSPIMHRCRLLLEKTPLNFLSCIGSAVSLVGAVNQHIRKLIVLLRNSSHYARELNELCMHDTGQFILLFFFFSFFLCLHWIDRAITGRWKELVWWELQLPGWSAVDENSIRGAYWREFCKLIIIMKMKPGCKYSNQRRPGLTRGGYLYTGFVVLNANLDVWPMLFHSLDSCS